MRSKLEGPSCAVKSKDERFYKGLGARIARTRRQRGITQVQLSATVGIAQQTLAHYEGGSLRLPASLLPALAQVLRITVGELLGQARPPGRGGGKRATARRLEDQVEAIAQLPRAKQRFVIEMLDTVLAQPNRRATGT
jgi:transcriptional regulator with XRE-family HTH domain